MPSSKSSGTFLGHPKGLFVLFFTEMWERFNYYGMRALLILYMTNFFKWPQDHSSKVYKWFTGLCYLTPLIGGYLADKYLGNKWAIILGASTMALGQFCMTVPNEQVFYIALGILVVGNGLFKPNMATQVGRLYPPNDARRDSAYTIFYMGINLGAFVAPILCAELREAFGYHAGFTAAGVGMLLGLFTYLFFIRWVRVAQPDEEPVVTIASPKSGAAGAKSVRYMTEEEANRTPSLVPHLTRGAPTFLALLGVAAVLISVGFAYFGLINANDAVAYGAGIGIACYLGFLVLRHIHGAARDRVLMIYLVGLFVIFFWGAFEQAGNAMNVFADKSTNRYQTQEAPEPSIYPTAPGESETGASDGPGGWEKFVARWNPVKTEWFQSINALAIFVLAPIFAWLWVWLPKKGINLSIPAKMALGVFLQGMAFALMIWAIRYENQPSEAPLSALPRGVQTDDHGRVVFRDAPNLDDEDWQAKVESAEVDVRHPGIVQGGRIRFDTAEKKLRISGVLSDTDRERIARATTSPRFLGSVRELALRSETLKEDDPNGVSVQLDETPPGFDLRYAGQKPDAVTFDPATRTLTTKIKLADRDYKGILFAGADAEFRAALDQLYVESAKFKISSQWLLWFYVLCTLGELCLSPVGLSMVSKLAPKAYGTMLMGTWHVMIFFGNYSAGLLGESYGMLHPARYFAYIAIALTVVSLICFLLVKKMRAMMHGVM